MEFNKGTPVYIADFITGPKAEYLKNLLSSLPLEKRDSSPRRECYMNDYLEPYTYGSGGFEKTFLPAPWDPMVLIVRQRLEALLGCLFEVCFINVYDDAHQHLGWHADDSPEMDDLRPIVSVSLGAEREIWTRPNGSKDPNDVTRYLLEDGSAFIMPPGYQDTHQHRIPKHHRECGVRLSMTFRGYASDR